MSAVLEVREPSVRNLAAARPALVRQFALLATAPGGVARLRELILTLAVQGRLVLQDHRDEPANLLLRRIEAERQRLVAAGQIRQAQAASLLAAGELPFNAPIGWVWARLDQLSPFGLSDGDWIETKDQDPNGEVRLIQLADIGDGLFKDKSSRFVSKATCTVLNCTLLRPADVLIARLPSPIGRACVFPGVGQEAITAVDVAICRIGSELLPAFIALAINAPQTRLLIESYGKGATRFRVSTGHLKTLPIAVPPVGEQARIVARVDELMRLCDALEAKGRLEAEQHARLLGTLLGTLTDSSTPEELAANWQRVADHFDLLLDRPEAVDALEQTILQLAVRGLLVPQEPSDEPAISLLQRVRLARENSDLPRRAKGGGSATSQAMIDEPFSLPPGWMWSTLPDLCAISGGSTPSKAVADNWIGDIPWVSPKDMKVSVIEDAQDHVSSAALAGSLSLIQPGSLLMVVRGMILAHSFPVAVTRVPVTINQDMKALTPFEPRLLPFLMLLCEGMKTEILALVDRSTHGTCKLDSPKIFGLRIPLPSLAEQVRIVARVSELRRLCADLRQRLATSETTQSHLAEALVDEVT